MRRFDRVNQKPMSVLERFRRNREEGRPPGADLPREAIGYGLPIAWIALLIALGGRLPPVARLLGATAGLLLSIKVSSWVLLPARGREFSLSPVETLVYWTVWPGVRPDLFGDPGQRRREPEARAFVEGYAFAAAGLALVVGALLAVPVVGVGTSTWLLLFGLLATFHQGVGRLLPFGLRWAGVPVPSLFDAPLRSEGVADFWSSRWNRPFVNMNRLYVTGPLSSRIGMGGAAAVAFVASGVLHELAISFPAGAGWGSPFLYFLVQGALYTVEETLFPDDASSSVLWRVWTYAGVLLPLPLLFHAPFRSTFLVPAIEFGRDLLFSYPPSAYLGLGLWVAAAGHFLVLVASSRVPAELDWHTDLQSLSAFNRKLLWTYGGFIVLTIVSFGVLTALFHGQFLAGNPVALGLAGMIAVFWTARVLVDAVYFSHDDWPGGLEFVVGHALLTSLFVLLVVVYAGTIAYHVL